MDYFNPNLFVEGSTKTATISDLNVNLEASYFLETLDVIQKLDTEFNNSNITFYRTIAENAGDSLALTESFNTFFESVKEIIDKFLKFIKAMFDRFLTMLAGMIKNDKYLISHKSEFSNFRTEHEFDYTGYEFTIVDSIPTTQVISEFIDNYDINFSDNVTSNVITSKYNNLINYLENDFYDSFRARVINKDGMITSDTFATELFSTFRNGTSDTSEIKVNGAYVSATYDNFAKYTSLKESVTKVKKNIETEYKKIKDELGKMETINNKYKTGESITIASANNSHVSKDYGDVSNIMIDKDAVNKLDLYIKAKVNQVQKMCDIHAMAFASKLDAIKANYKQDKVILYKALYKIQNPIKKGGK